MAGYSDDFLNLKPRNRARRCADETQDADSCSIRELGQLGARCRQNSQPDLHARYPRSNHDRNSAFALPTLSLICLQAVVRSFRAGNRTHPNRGGPPAPDSR